MNECLGSVLELLENQTVKPFEIIVVDQTPLDKSPKDFYLRFKSLTLKILNLDKPSFSNARNLAAKECKGDIFLFIDDDI